LIGAFEALEKGGEDLKKYVDTLVLDRYKEFFDKKNLAEAILSFLFL